MFCQLLAAVQGWVASASHQVSFGGGRGAQRIRTSAMLASGMVLREPMDLCDVTLLIGST